MEFYHPATRRGDGRLWAIALGLSLGLNLALLIAFGIIGLSTVRLRDASRPVARAQDTPAQATVEIYPEMLKKVAPEATASPPPESAATPAPAPPVVTPPPSKRFARTSDDQRGKRPDKPAFMGERDTQAASDRAPDASAPPLPSQAGVDPKSPGDFETTESRYHDGKLPDRNLPSLESSGPPEPSPETAASSETSEISGESDTGTAPFPPPAAAASTPPPLREKLLTGPNPVEVPVPAPAEETREKTDDSSTKRPAETAAKPADASPARDASKAAKPKARQPVKDPAFSGFQRKTAIRGSISRTGRSSLDVEDSPLGRYQAAISRAVELEWQRNCVRHRDFITPGFLTLRFTVEPSGKVRSVKFVDGMQTGEVQKGFTLNAIRDAAIPPMPASIRKDYAKEPLELIFNFYF
ncbi:MAG: cell envelope integrity protein TolA [Luteolibacter sp.]